MKVHVLLQLLSKTLLESTRPVKRITRSIVLACVIKDTLLIWILPVIHIVLVSCLPTNNLQCRQETLAQFPGSMCRVVKRVCDRTSRPRVLPQEIGCVLGTLHVSDVELLINTTRPKIHTLVPVHKNLHAPNLLRQWFPLLRGISI